MNKAKANKTKYLSANAPDELVQYLRAMGYKVELVPSLDSVDPRIASHADIQMCRLGCHDDALVIQASQSERAAMCGEYPNDILFNAACTGKFFIHNLKYTNARLLNAARDAGIKFDHDSGADSANNSSMVFIDVPQGYTKCSVVVVDENSIITYDQGIARACEAYNRGIADAYKAYNRGIARICDSHNINETAAEPLEVLLIEPGQVELEGYNTGFIGGASGRVGDTIVFCGDITAHTNASQIIAFIKNRGLEIKYFDFPLKDIGSII